MVYKITRLQLSECHTQNFLSLFLIQRTEGFSLRTTHIVFTPFPSDFCLTIVATKIRTEEGCKERGLDTDRESNRGDETRRMDRGKRR